MTAFTFFMLPTIIFLSIYILAHDDLPVVQNNLYLYFYMLETFILGFGAEQVERNC